MPRRTKSPEQGSLVLQGATLRQVSHYRLPLMGAGFDEQPEDGSLRMVDALFVGMIEGGRQAAEAKKSRKSS